MEAMKETRRIAAKNKIEVALTFSDASMVKYFGTQMNEIVGEGVGESKPTMAASWVRCQGYAVGRLG